MAERRGIDIEAYPELKEYQWDPKSFQDNDVKKFGYLFESSKSKNAIGGIEEADEFYNRVTRQLEKIIKEDWSQIAIVLHGAVNAAIMCWLNDIDISLASKFDQDHAALILLILIQKKMVK
jgi:broad specificity phosphatase PhoE